MNAPMNLAEYEAIQPNAVVDGLTFLLPNQQCAWRVQTLYTKEPDTIAWLRSMPTNATLFDIGANMGQYAMFAAKRGLRVHAFEPEAQNFALLVRNIAANNLSERCTAWPLALSDKPSMDILHLSSMSPGGSCHAFGAPINFKGEQHAFPFQQGAVATTLDNFSSKHGVPSFIKIDVDGFEHLVVKGGEDTFAHAQSVLIEINTAYPAHMDFVLPKMAELGFTFDPAQVDSSQRKEGTFKGVGNYIFFRP